MSLVSEIRDIKLCEISLRRISSEKHRGLAVIRAIRTYCIIPMVIAIIPEMLIWRGSDAFSICMNTVAILFVLEIDNFVYSHGLPADVVAEFEEKHHMVLSE